MSTTEHSIDEQETPLDPDEPHTPTWFTFFGIGLFLLGGIFLLITSDGEEPPPVTPAVEAGEPAPAAAAEGAAPAAKAPEAPADPHAGHGHD